MKSNATTVDAYLAELPDDRRETVATIRRLVGEALPDGFEEAMDFGMICWGVPLEHYPDTYNGRPLQVAALASQKRHCSLYLHGAYMDPELVRRIEQGFQAAGKKLDMGKSCVRFKAADDLPESVIRDVVGAMDPDAFIELYERARSR